MTRTRTRPDARRGAALAVLSAAQFLVALDYSIVYVALPAVADGLRMTGALAQWVVSAYAVVFAGLLILGGRLTDRAGGRRMFLVAVLLFGGASAAAGAAYDGGALVAARGVQGLAAALLQPAVLGLLGAAFPAGAARARALAVWGSVGAAGLAAGVVLGGALTTVSWRWVFLVNVPLTAVCAAGAVAWLPRMRGASTTRVPFRATAWATGAVVSVTLALTSGAAWGWGAVPTLVPLAAGTVLAALFVRHERWAARGAGVVPPVLVEPGLRRARSLRGGAVAVALYMASVGSEFYLLTLLLQRLDGYPPLRAGLAFLPAAVLVTAGSVSAGRAMRRWAPAPVLATGFAVCAAGLAALALAPGGPYATALLPGLLLSGYGHGVVYTSTFALGTRDVPRDLHGTAGALLTTAQYVSGAVTVAVLTIVLGPAPGPAAFRAGFLITTAAALAGLLTAAAHHTRHGRHPAGGAYDGAPPTAAARPAASRTTGRAG